MARSAIRSCPRSPARPAAPRRSRPTRASEILHIRHHSLYTPRDFDLSPYFRIVKPTLEYGFDYRAVTWDDKAADAKAAE